MERREFAAVRKALDTGFEYIDIFSIAGTVEVSKWMVERNNRETVSFNASHPVQRYVEIIIKAVQ